MGRWVAIFNMIVRGALVEEVIFKQGLEKSLWGRIVQSHSWEKWFHLLPVYTQVAFILNYIQFSITGWHSMSQKWIQTLPPKQSSSRKPPLFLGISPGSGRGTHAFYVADEQLPSSRKNPEGTAAFPLRWPHLWGREAKQEQLNSSAPCSGRQCAGRVVQSPLVPWALTIPRAHC